MSTRHAGHALPAAARGDARARPRLAREGDVAGGGGQARQRRRSRRHRRLHPVAHADRHDLGADPRAQEGPRRSRARSPPPRAICCSPPACPSTSSPAGSSQGIVWGVSKVMRHYTENKLARFEEWSHMSIGLRYRAGAMGIPFMPSRSMIGSDVGKRVGDEIKTMACPFTGEQVDAAAGAQPGRGADPRAALRRLRQRPARRPAVHGHRHGDGGQPRDPDHRAHRLQRPDPAHARPDAHPLLHRGGRGGGADRLRAARVLRRSTSRSSRHLDDYAERISKDPVQGLQAVSRGVLLRPASPGPITSAKLGMDAVLDAMPPRQERPQ